MSELDFSLCLSGTEFFEIASSLGHQYGVWVTAPPNHDPHSGEPLPIVYVLDGNFAVGLTAPLAVMCADPMLMIRPYLQVTIGYVGVEAGEWARVRNRDLVPPGEPIASHMVTALEEAARAGTVTEEYCRTYLAELSDTHADDFLRFITDELHPFLTSNYHVSEDGHGLFGYSYGGLFALYAWTHDVSVFDTIGAGSPGIATPESSIYECLDEFEKHSPTNSDRLHITLNESELTGAQAIYRALSRNTLVWIDQVRMGKRTDDLTVAVLSETHVTGMQASFLSYQRSCRAVSTTSRWS